MRAAQRARKARVRGAWALGTAGPPGPASARARVGGWCFTRRFGFLIHNIYIYIYVYTYIYIYIYLHAYVHVHAYVYTCTCTYNTCTYILYIYIYSVCVCVYIYIYIAVVCSCFYQVASRLLRRAVTGSTLRPAISIAKVLLLLLLSSIAAAAAAAVAAATTTTFTLGATMAAEERDIGNGNPGNHCRPD